MKNKSMNTVMDIEQSISNHIRIEPSCRFPSNLKQHTLEAIIGKGKKKFQTKNVKSKGWLFINSLLKLVY